MRKHKKMIIAVIFLAVVIGLNMTLNFMLVQPGLGRTILHEVSQGEYNSVIIGASHGSYGLVPDVIDEQTGLNTMNLCMGGEYMRDAYHVLQYALKYNDLDTVVLDIDYQYLVNYHKESILHNAVYNAYPNSLDKVSYYFDKVMTEDYRGTFLRWTNYWQCYKYIPKTVAKKLSEAYQNYESSVVSMNKYDTYMGEGFISRSKDSKKDMTGAVKWNESKVSSSEVGFIKKIAQLCSDNDIELVFTTVAVDPSTITEDTANYENAGKYIQNLADELGVTYLDFNYISFDYYDRTTDDYYDKEGHMYGETAQRFSEIYGTVLKQALDGTLNKNEYFASDLTQLYQ